ncbi:chitin deacetylase 8 [Hydra vulgaris]|uniref:Chitin deacetylase 8 n=1 Tax=Hydra vulgaris TaxID=6087 RepID=A0ABM4DIB9_HYDVU
MEILWYFFVLLCSVLPSETIPLPQAVSSTCEVGKFYHDTANCSVYFTCSNGQKLPLSCPLPLVWDNVLLTCFWSSSTCQIPSSLPILSSESLPLTAELVTQIVTTQEQLPFTIETLQASTAIKTTTTSKFTITLPPTTSIPKVAETCENGKYYSDPNNCSRYFICNNGQKIQLACPASLKWDNTLLSCTWTSSCQASDDIVKTLENGFSIATSVPATLTTRSSTSASNQKSYVKAILCEQSKCKLPNCRCASEEIPGNLRKEDIPQIVMWTMDDAVNAINYNFYMELFNNMKNPNGCPVGTTYYVSGEYTDFNLVKNLFQKGHEIADHSITHRSPNLWWKDSTYSELELEIIGEKKMLEEKSGATITGWRTPFLRPGETLYRVLADNNFLYDTSLSTHAGTKWWPFTLDYLIPKCVDEPCPELSYPGLWEVPLNPLYDGENGPECSMFDSCVRSLNDSSENVYKNFMDNFNRHYKDKKQPFSIFGHSAFFLHESFVYRQLGFKKFLSEISRLPDVYFVTVEQAIRWTQNPTPLSQLNTFAPWSCKKK